MTEKLSEKEIEDFDVEQTDHYPVMRCEILFYFHSRLFLYISAEIEA